MPWIRSGPGTWGPDPSAKGLAKVGPVHGGCDSWSWDFIGFYGISWSFMGFHGIVWILWDFMGFHGMYGISWDFMVMGFYWILWDFIGFHGISCDLMGFYAIWWDFMGFYGYGILSDFMVMTRDLTNTNGDVLMGITHYEHMSISIDHD